MDTKHGMKYWQSVEAERDALSAVNAELVKVAKSVVAWYENAGPDQSSVGSVDLWKQARAALAKARKVIP